MLLSLKLFNGTGTRCQSLILCQEEWINRHLFGLLILKCRPVTLSIEESKRKWWEEVRQASHSTRCLLAVPILFAEYRLVYNVGLCCLLC